MSDEFVGDFVAGPADGQKIAMNYYPPEYRFALVCEMARISAKRDDRVHYDYAVYRYIGHGVYLFHRVEHE